MSSAYFSSVIDVLPRRGVGGPAEFPPPALPPLLTETHRYDRFEPKFLNEIKDKHLLANVRVVARIPFWFVTKLRSASAKRIASFVGSRQRARSRAPENASALGQLGRGRLGGWNRSDIDIEPGGATMAGPSRCYLERSPQEKHVGPL